MYFCDVHLKIIVFISTQKQNVESFRKSRHDFNKIDLLNLANLM